MRVSRRTPDGTVYNASFTGKPTDATLEALDVVADAAARQFELQRAARHLLDTIAKMTTEDFAKGADREARLRLARALGLPEADYGL